MAVDYDGNIVTSTSPAGGASAWTVVDGVDNVPYGTPQGFNEVSCPTVSLCVAVDQSGNVATSAHPTGGASAWILTKVDGSNGLAGISCPSALLCVAVDGLGDVVTSTDPAGGAAKWSVADADGDNPINGISCPTVSLCVGVDGGEDDDGIYGDVVFSADPTGGASAWHFTYGADPYSNGNGEGGNGLGAVSCPTVTLCVAVNDVGDVVTSTNPKGSASAWTVTDVDSDNQISGVSCPTASLCFVFENDGNVVISTKPTGGAGDWSVSHIGAFVGLSAVSCPSISLCVAVDDFGDIVTSTEPTGGPSAWTVTNVDGTTDLAGVSCPTVSLCVAVDDFGDIITSTEPTGGAPAWTRTDVDGTNALGGVSCPSISLCVAFDTDGNVLTSTNPTGGASAWKITATGVYMTAVSCPSISLCVAVEGNPDGTSDSGIVVTSTNPTGGASSWKVVDADPEANLSGVSCPTVSFCAVVGWNYIAAPQVPSDYVVTSTDPTGGASAWHVTDVGGDTTLNTLDDISCPTVSLCVAGGLDANDQSGDIVTSPDPTGGPSAWAVTTGVDPNGSVFGMSCPSVSLCMTFGGLNVRTSTDPTGGASDWKVTDDTDGAPLVLGGVSCPTASLCVGVDVGDVITGTAASGSTAPDGSGTLSVAPGSVSTGSSANTETFTYSAAAGGTAKGEIEVAVPSGWSAPSTTASAPGDSTSTCGTVAVSGSTVALSGVTLAGGATCTITYGSRAGGGPGAAAPSSTGTSTFVASEKSSAAGTLSALATSPSVAVVNAPGPYSPLTPTRICDSRAGNPSGLSGAAAQCNGVANAGATIPAGGTKVINVAGDFGVPPGATAVVLNVAAVNPIASGWLTIFPTGASQPSTSNLNYSSGEVVPNLVEVGTGTSGEVSIYSQAKADVVVDLEGYVAPSASGGPGAGLYMPLSSPARLCDTRAGNPSGLTGGDTQCNGAGNAGTRLAAGATHSVVVTGNNAIPEGATAAVLNVTAVNPAVSGWLTVFPGGAAQPTTANVNYGAGQTTGNRVIVPLPSKGATAGQIAIYSAAAADVIVDVSGYYSAAGGSGSLFSAEPAPVRICDTRAGDPSGLTGPANQCDAKTLGPGATRTIAVTGLAGVPSGAKAVVVNLTAVLPTASTYLTVFPGPAQPTVSDLNPAQGDVEANLTVATLSASGTISIYNNTGSVDVVVDVLGWYSAAG